MKKEETATVPIELIQSLIISLRGQKVMLDRNLPELYGVETKQLKRAVRRNIKGFPPDFMFELAKEEYDFLRCQIGTLKRGEHSLCIRSSHFRRLWAHAATGEKNTERTATEDHGVDRRR
jgi:hypothetical protein